MIEPTRRDVLGGLAALVAVGPFASSARAADPRTLIAAERPRVLMQGAKPTAVWSFDERWPLVLRTPRGEMFSARLENALAEEHTAIHWHGIRVPFAMDGVPYITQEPVLPGGAFDYAFVPPDPGTFFFHPHCNTVEQLGRGLAGVLIVEDPREAGLFDVDHVMLVKDWALEAGGGFGPFITDKGAATAGTFGTFRSVNAKPLETLTARPGSIVRLRIVNVDVTRVIVPAIEGADAQIIATDGHAMTPLPLGRWKLGPAMRLDIVFQMPQAEGAVVRLVDAWGLEPYPLARVTSEGASAHPAQALPTLPAADLPEPDLTSAIRLPLELTAGHVDPAFDKIANTLGLTLDDLCRATRTYWAINRTPWPGMGHRLKPPPLHELARGKSYLFEIVNATPHLHPMHLHGHVFKVVSSSKGDVPVHWADTVLARPKERLEIALVAGEPGDWMVHCHIIEHQETGMMGYVRVA
ncbi:MAG: multicopper oxidase domain-containing protein [Alphaproteobacteria bacterium]|nr:multicopper oxidase domain-containing protein [Alphaproteobacteria bacterium]